MGDADTPRRVWGFRLVGRELAGLPDYAHLHFMWLWRQLGESDVAPDGIWQLYGRQLWIYEITSGGRIYRMAIEIMPEGWVMVWAHGAAAVLRRRLDQRLRRVGLSGQRRRWGMIGSEHRDAEGTE